MLAGGEVAARAKLEEAAVEAEVRVGDARMVAARGAKEEGFGDPMLSLRLGEGGWSAPSGGAASGRGGCSGEETADGKAVALEPHEKAEERRFRVPSRCEGPSKRPPCDRRMHPQL